ncbi:MAG TPA: pantoate--beta-alanine ligase [Gammaproteobacteria bacterium]|jgi:pantoate--beta-alanine ligase|nr:pantoate--beta-alanine ligase [Gammaproteobacteria bacterium]
MLVVDDVAKLRAILKPWKSNNVSIGFVPTMGNLHAGHLSLINRAKDEADKVVASIYVNPLQFDRPDDLSRYPRTLEDDLQSLETDGVDVVFTPSDKMIYPDGIEMSTKVDVPVISRILCGAHRPGHFVGVATVVCKLFNMVEPDVAIFGEKDFQQLMLIRRMTEDLNLPVKVLGAETLREENGLAMSSRNNYLSAEERDTAATIYRMLRSLAERLAGGDQYYPGLESDGKALLEAAGFIPDYVSVLRKIDLQQPAPEEPVKDLVIVCAAILGNARLIDNLQLSHYLAAR